jgi:hypothetical protein
VDKLNLLRERARLRGLVACPHGLRPEECQECSPRKEPERMPPKPVPVAQDRPGDAQAGADGYGPGSQAATVLRAAREFGGPFTLADLAVCAWHADKKALGLEGYEQHFPDVRKVHCCLYGPSGLLTKKRLRRVAGGKLEVAR